MAEDEDCYEIKVCKRRFLVGTNGNSNSEIKRSRIGSGRIREKRLLQGTQNGSSDGNPEMSSLSGFPAPAHALKSLPKPSLCRINISDVSRFAVVGLPCDPETHGQSRMLSPGMPHGGRSSPESSLHNQALKGEMKLIAEPGGILLVPNQAAEVAMLADADRELGDTYGETLGDETELKLSEEEAEATLTLQLVRKEFNTLLAQYKRQSEKDKLRRPDLQAGKFMRENSRVIYNKPRRIGHLPGIRVGDAFFCRQEMAVVGMNLQAQGGIDQIPPNESGFSVSVATCVVASGGYEDDVDRGDWFEYTGQGGNNYLGDRRQGKNQELTKGNLALANSYDLQTPVRVVRGSPEPNSFTGTVYTYDGLYLVASWREELGESGFKVFKFRLERIPGQPPLSSPQVEFIRVSLKEDLPASARKGLVCSDISGGQEVRPVCCVNTIDEPPGAPPSFTYTNKVILPNEGLEDLKPIQTCCTCTDGCRDPQTCECARLNGEVPYVEGGGLVIIKPCVWECGPMCRCAAPGRRCLLRVSQRGVKFRLEVFRTPSKGWAVRSWDAIPPGQFVCEYTGKVICGEKAENLLGEDEYLFNLDFVAGVNTRWGSSKDQEPLLRGQAVGEAGPPASDGGDRHSGNVDYVLDAAQAGGVARFINHSCNPNLAVQNVFYDHHDIRLPHIMLFATQLIPPLKELTYDYGYQIGTVADRDGNLKKLACHCGAPKCKRFLY